MRSAWLTIALGVLVAAPSAADACSISAAPAANVFGRPDTDERGHRPWIRLWMVKPTERIQLNLIDAGCSITKNCPRSTPVAFERIGAFVRPTKDLASGARVQVMHRNHMLAYFTVSATDATKDLPAWDGITAARATTLPEGMCEPAGPAITLTVKPTKADLGDAVLLVYLAKPDPKRPAAGLGAIYSLGTLSGTGELTLRGGHGDAWLKKKPAKIWTALSDGDGHIGAVTEHAL